MKNSIILTLIAISTIMSNSIKLDAQTEKMTPEILWDLGRVSLDHINNNLVIYGVTNYDLKKNKGNRELYLADLNTGANTQLTNSPENDYSSFLIKGGNSYVFIKKGQLYISNTNKIKALEENHKKTKNNSDKLKKENRKKLSLLENNLNKIKEKNTKGGRGNSHFKSSTNQSPHYAQPSSNFIYKTLVRKSSRNS